MTEGKLVLISAAVGAAGGIIGALGGALITGLIGLYQSKSQDRRDAIKLAAEAAWKDYELRAGKGIPSSPAFIFVWYHVRLMQLIERGKLTREAITQVHLEKGRTQQSICRYSRGKGERLSKPRWCLRAYRPFVSSSRCA
jgi:hypothetical protein